MVNDDPLPGDRTAAAVAEAARSGVAARYLTENSGMAAARRAGAAAARGAILLHLDADMRLTPRLVESCVRGLRDGFDALVLPEVAAGPGFWERCKALEKRCYLGVEAIEALRCIGAAAYRRLGGHDPELEFWADQDLDLRARAAGLRVGRCAEPVIHDEGERGLLSTLRKKRRYAAAAGAYAARHPASYGRQTSAVARLRLVLRAWRLGLEDPLGYAGIFVLGLAELAGLRLGLRDAAKAEALDRSSAGLRVQFGVPSYCEGPLVVRTLESIRVAAVRAGVAELSVILSDSSPTPGTAEAAIVWAQGAGADLLVDRSETRRSCKEARNVLMEHADADVLIQVDADVALAPDSVGLLLGALAGAEVVSGCTVPAPDVPGLRRRASAWQLKLVRGLASRLPVDEVRIEGAIWGARRSFYSRYRFPVGAGSIQDNVAVDRHLRREHVPTRNCWRAVAYKIPAATLEDFFLQTHRYYASLDAGEPQTTARRRTVGLAAAVEAVRDPLGALLYVRARLWSGRRARRGTRFEEQWEVALSTKRLPSAEHG